MKKPKKPKSAKAAKKAKRHKHAAPIGALGHDRPQAKPKAQVVHRLAPELNRLATKPLPARAPAAAISSSATPYSADDRSAMALLLLPFAIVAMSLGISQTMKRDGRLAIEAAMPAPPVVVAPAPVIETALVYPVSPPNVPALALAPSVAVALAPPVPAPAAVVLPGPMPAMSAAAPAIAVPEVELPGAIAAWPMPLPSIETGPGAEERQRLAAWLPPVTPWQLDPAPPEVGIAAPLDDGGVCRPKPGMVLAASRRPATLLAYTPMPAADFGLRLAAAARAQTEDLVVYTARYHHMAPAMGDLPSIYGACSDLLIRAYRAMGVDLQDLVRRARVGSGDPSIDHRRTETLRSFFNRHATVLAITAFPEDYKPGDIVTYYRPFSRVSRAHVAIVSDQIAPTGRPMIIHNRGWGPQLEDALFVDRITGHYRYQGPREATTVVAGAGAATPLAPASAVPLPIPKALMLAPPRRVATGLAAKIK